LLEEALAIHENVFGNHHPATALALENLARMYDAEGKNAQAEQFYHRSIAMFDTAPVAARDGCIRYAGRAGFFHKINQLDKAVADLKRAIELSLEVRRRASGTEEQRAVIFAGFYHLFEMMVEWQNQRGNMEEVYEAMESSRAQGLQDLIESHGIDLFEGMDAATAIRLKKKMKPNHVPPLRPRKNRLKC
jgi:tetratricopeptide (TPR) repeat protein